MPNIPETKETFAKKIGTTVEKIDAVIAVSNKDEMFTYATRTTTCLPLYPTP
jgi:hypothetical protein